MRGIPVPGMPPGAGAADWKRGSSWAGVRRRMPAHSFVRGAFGDFDHPCERDRAPSNSAHGSGMALPYPVGQSARRSEGRLDFLRHRFTRIRRTICPTPQHRSSLHRAGPGKWGVIPSATRFGDRSIARAEPAARVGRNVEGLLALRPGSSGRDVYGEWDVQFHRGLHFGANQRGVRFEA